MVDDAFSGQSRIDGAQGGRCPHRVSRLEITTSYANTALSVGYETETLTLQFGSNNLFMPLTKKGLDKLPRWLSYLLHGNG